MFTLWIKGVLLGFSIAAPVGPIGLLCIRRTLAQGRRAGFLSGLGAASADALYGSLAAFGLTAVYTALSGVQFWLQLFGACFLLWLGWQTFRTPPAVQAAPAGQRGGLAGVYVSTFLLTLSNPMTILSFLAVFSGAGLATSSTQGWQGALALVLGVFCGSSLWWLLLSGGVHFLSRRLGQNFGGGVLVWVNRLAGAGLVCFGLAALWPALARFIA